MRLSDTNKSLKEFLDEKVNQFNRIEFINDDPIQIPHLFQKKQDIEIAAFFAATLAWGQRKTIINKCKELMSLMDNSPYEFIQHLSDKELKKLSEFKHRTFNETDLLYFIEFFKSHYSKSNSLEDAFLINGSFEAKSSLISFHQKFFTLPYHPNRTKKHVATPERKSACKRINMFLRWMVRKDNNKVDFGIWNQIKPSQLICPIDLHVERVARRLKLIKRKQVDWETAEELTQSLRQFDALDPIKYDFALFGIGVNER